MLPKSIPIVVALVILATACSPSMQAVTPSGTSQVSLEVTPSAVPSSAPTTVAATRIVPKQGDLIFVEFFAVT